MIDVSLLSLFPATPAQVQVSRERSYVQWGRGLPLPAYIGRAGLDDHEHAADGAHRTWVLAPRSDPQTLDFFCACDTFRRAALVLPPSAAEPEPAVAYGVASVFCAPTHRQRSYATHMMRLLHYVLAPSSSLPEFPPEWGTPPVPPPGTANARFSALWSDIGPDFYASCGPAPGHPGWILYNPIATTWRLDPKASLDAPSEVQWLSEEDCITLWDSEDTKYITTRLCGRPSHDTTTRCTFLPNHGLAAFQLHRTRFYLPAVPDAPLPTTWGVRIPGKNAYATYITDIRPRPLALLVTRLRVSLDDLPTLLAALKHAARTHGAETVEVWNLPQELLANAHSLGGYTAPRDDHLSALAWYGPEDPKEIEWCFNEKFCWC